MQAENTASAPTFDLDQWLIDANAKMQSVIDAFIALGDDVFWRLYGNGWSCALPSPPRNSHASAVHRPLRARG